MCQRLVISDDEYPTLAVGYPFDIELDAGLPLFYRVPLHGVCSPIKFEIVYKSLLQNFDIYLHSKNKMPSGKDCELSFRNVDQFYVSCLQIGQSNMERVVKDIQEKVGVSQLKKELLIKEFFNERQKQSFFKDSFLYFQLVSFSGCSL